MKVVYTPITKQLGIKTMRVVKDHVVFLINNSWETIIPNLYIDYYRGGTSIYIDAMAYLTGTNIDSIVISIPVAYMIDNTYYYGVGSQGLVTSDIQLLSKVFDEKKSQTFAFSPNSEVFYYAYPTNFGLLTSILDTNELDIISDFTVTTRRFNLSLPNYPGVQTYYVYEFNLPTIQTNFNLTFNF